MIPEHFVALTGNTPYSTRKIPEHHGTGHEEIDNF
jgi:hypothetical protein